MKGLVFKDLLLMKKMNKKVIFVMYFFVIAISFFGENEVYSIMSSAFFSLFIGMHLMMTMTYDGLTSWKQYELTLPPPEARRSLYTMAASVSAATRAMRCMEYCPRLTDTSFKNIIA